MNAKYLWLAPIPVLLVALLSMHSCQKEQESNKVAKIGQIAVKVSSVASSIPHHQVGVGSVEVTENFKTNAGVVAVPVATVTTLPNTPITVDIPGRTYSVETTVTKTDDSFKADSTMTIKVEGKSFSVPVVTTIRDVVAPSRFRFAPTLTLGFGAMAPFASPLSVDAAPSVAVFAAAHGNRWLFGGVGAGVGLVSRQPFAMVVPVALILSGAVPIVRNTYVGIGLTVDLGGNVGVLAGLNVAL